MRTEPRMVKNFLVVVKMEHVRGPKLVMVVNMKFCVCVCVCVCVWDGGRDKAYLLTRT